MIRIRHVVLYILYKLISKRFLLDVNEQEVQITVSLTDLKLNKSIVSYTVPISGSRNTNTKHIKTRLLQLVKTNAIAYVYNQENWEYYNNNQKSTINKFAYINEFSIYMTQCINKLKTINSKSSDGLSLLNSLEKTQTHMISLIHKL